jgi:hypothetical protein
VVWGLGAWGSSTKFYLGNTVGDKQPEDYPYLGKFSKVDNTPTMISCVLMKRTNLAMHGEAFSVSEPLLRRVVFGELVTVGENLELHLVAGYEAHYIQTQQLPFI